MDADRTAAATRRNAGEAKDALGDGVGDVRDQIKAKADQAMGMAHDLYGRAADRARGVAGDVDTMIDDQPYVALGVAAIAGVAVGLILGLTIASRD